MRNVDGAGKEFNGRPFPLMPQIIQDANRNPPIDHPRLRTGGDVGVRTVLPRARKEQHLFSYVGRHIRMNKMVNVLANTGSLPQGGPVVDENAHDGRVQSRR